MKQMICEIVVVSVSPLKGLRPLRTKQRFKAESGTEFVVQSFKTIRVRDLSTMETQDDDSATRSKRAKRR